MFFYFVKDASGWISNFLSKSIDEAIISQSWRMEDPLFVASDEFPLTIFQIDTELGFIKKVKMVYEDEMIARFRTKDSEQKGGSK